VSDEQSTTALDWALRPLLKYAEFNGRAPRAEYWGFVLASSIASFVLAFIDARISQPIFAGFGPLRLAFAILLLLPTYAVTVRRLHDANATGWWVLARISTYPILLVRVLHLDLSVFDKLSGWFIAAFVVLGLGCVCAETTLLVFLFIRGTEGSNPLRAGSIRA
jgi:uncharacterized membrane protein YhaH (DUF805 family)